MRRSILALVGLALAWPLSGLAAGDAAPAAPDLHKNWGFLDKYCGNCHNATDWAGGVAFDTLQPESVGQDAEVWEKAVRKLRGRMMPPPGEPQPDSTSLQAFASAMEVTLDLNAAAHPNPGSVSLHRLNKPEYANAIRDLLALDVDASSLLPRDDQSSGFDNSAEVLKVSPSFLDQYLTAARQVSIQAVGNPGARVLSKMYPGSGQAGQYMHLEGLPLGTRGGMLIEHDFPVDGDYEFTVNGLVGAGYLWGVMDAKTLLVTVDDQRVFEAQLGGPQDLDAVDLQQAQGVGAINDRFRNIKAHVTAGPHRIGITFRQNTAAESNEILHAFVPVEGMAAPVNGNSGGPRISNVEIRGPLAKAGVSQTASRRKIFGCYPSAPEQEMPCAKQIFSTLARQAFRRPITDADLDGALALYAQGRKLGDFDAGIQKGLMAILVSPKFLYREHTPPPGLRPGESFRINDIDLASRLSFFLWSAPPDEALITLAAAGKLGDPKVLDLQVRRMLADPRAHALVTNFAFQWLNVHGVELVNPDQTLFPDYTEDLVQAFQTELELFVGSIFESDRSVMDLLTDNHGYVNERLALHYGLHDVRGGQYRRIEFKESYRRGLLGKGAFLMATSYANRTTPVLRGAYILEHLLGTPPAAPPPNVSAFPESQEGGEQFTVRARMESHRKMKSCASCHGVIDPLGLALENFNAVGQWRDKDIDAGTAIDASGQLVDGTPLHGPDDLRNALVARPVQFVSTFTENLMTFALGRSLAYYDMPTLRAIVRNAAADNYRFSSIVLGIVNSPAFLMDRIPQDKASPVSTRTAQRQ
jgi:mono/diheme cytochrome c family protein